MKDRQMHLETIALHAGQEQADPATDSRAVPIYQTTSYVFDSCSNAADRFALRAPGNIYGRMTNSTQAVLEQRVAALEGGKAALALASGAAAVTCALQNVLQQGDRFGDIAVVADRLVEVEHHAEVIFPAPAEKFADFPEYRFPPDARSGFQYNLIEAEPDMVNSP